MALVLAFFSILAGFAIHICISVGVAGKDGILRLWISCNAFMSGHCVVGCVGIDMQL